MSEELKPCPFCGCEIILNGSYTIEHPHFFGGSCDNCEAIGPIKSNKEEGIKAWNARTDQWQPIETAPKDGSQIDLWCEGKLSSERRPFCYWGELSDLSGKEGEGWMGVYRPYEDFTPTHWMPLPEPPKTT